MQDLSGQWVLVTGGAVRIGAAIVRAFSAAGAGVLIHCRSSLREAEALAAETLAAGRPARVLQADLTSEAACVGLIEQSRAACGDLSVLVNSAAVFHKHTLRQAGMPEILAEWWPNLFAPWQLMRALAARQASARVVNLLDRRLSGHDTSCAPYVLAKKALHELTALAALEFAPGFTVNAVAPGPVLPPPGLDEDYLREHAGRVPLQRRCTPESVAAAVLFLARSPELTGNTLFVDGGQHLLGNGV